MMSDSVCFLDAGKTVSSNVLCGHKPRRWLLTSDKWESLGKQDGTHQCISLVPKHSDSLLILSFP